MSDDEIVNVLQSALIHGGEQMLEVVPMALGRVIRERRWTERCDKQGKPFPSFEAFVRHRLWQGLESSIDDLRAFCRKHPEVDKLIVAEVEPQPVKGTNQHSVGFDNVKPSRTVGGNAATYTLKRLKRDRPDLFDRVVAGELSANAAAIEAGFRQPPSPLKQLRKAWVQASPDERAEFLAEISAGSAGSAGKAESPQSPQRPPA